MTATEITTDTAREVTTNPLDSMSMEEYVAARANPIVNAAASAETETESATGTPAAVEVDEDEAGKTSTESATEGEEGDVSKLDEGHPAKKSLQKRFGEMTAKQKTLQAEVEARDAQLAQAKAEAEQTQAELSRLRQEAAKAAQAAIPIVQDAEFDARPVSGDFNDPDDFVTALAAHAARAQIREAANVAQQAADARQTEFQQAQQAEQQAKANQQIAALHAAHNQRVAAVKPEYPDFDERVTNNADIQIRNDIFYMAEKSNDGPHLLYHFATNPAVLAELNKMDQMEAALKMGEIAAELREKRKPKPTRAAAPITPIGSGKNPSAKKPEDMSMDEYVAYRQGQKTNARQPNPARRAGNR